MLLYDVLSCVPHNELIRQLLPILGWRGFFSSYSTLLIVYKVSAGELSPASSGNTRGHLHAKIRTSHSAADLSRYSNARYSRLSVDLSKCLPDACPSHHCILSLDGGLL